VIPALTLLPDRLAVVRLSADQAFPAWVHHDDATFWSITRTPDEWSIVCDRHAVPPSCERVEDGWRTFVLAGPIPFDTVGVIASLTAPLAAAGIAVFVLSTFDTDYLLVKETALAAALAVLRPLTPVHDAG
jgi:hypothetical protein